MWDQMITVMQLCTTLPSSGPVYGLNKTLIKQSSTCHMHVAISVKSDSHQTVRVFIHGNSGDSRAGCVS